VTDLGVPVVGQHAPSEHGATTLTGTGLHTGARCAVTLEKRPGPVLIATSAGRFARHELAVSRTDRGVRVRLGESAMEIELVEHLFAALGGLGVQHGVCASVSGGEVPLLDGGARALCRALVGLGVEHSVPPLRVVRSASYVLGNARFRLEPDRVPRIEVEVAFGSRGPESARWDGAPDDFVERIAPARTFGFASEIEALRARGRAAFIDRSSVIALDDEGRGMPPDRGPGDGELARHKLLDLVGDLYLYGGPPLGRLTADRPGHAANHAMVTRALEDGVLHFETST
jgi:UDP-3-O-[3-hydroxymyristoyl] N-acetylglucosamine deacetylase